jgi:hypothetical protein
MQIGRRLKADAGVLSRASPRTIRSLPRGAQEKELEQKQNEINALQEQISRGKFDRFPRATAGFTTSALDGY